LEVGCYQRSEGNKAPIKTAIEWTARSCSEAVIVRSEGERCSLTFDDVFIGEFV
jgi:hypothetical protein